MNYYFIKNGVTSGPLQMEDIIKICDDETLICIEDGKITDWKAAKFYPEYLIAKENKSAEIEENNYKNANISVKRVPPPPPVLQQEARKAPPPIPSNKLNNSISLNFTNKLFLVVVSLTIFLVLTGILINPASDDSSIDNSLFNNFPSSTFHNSANNQDEKQNEAIESKTIDGIYTGTSNISGMELVATLNINGEHWSAKSQLGYDSPEYQNGVVKGNTLYDNSGMVKVGLINGNSANINGYPHMNKR